MENKGLRKIKLENSEEFRDQEAERFGISFNQRYKNNLRCNWLNKHLN